ncbi:MAG TPA: hypothetical protein VJ352_05660 [Geodermatophilus sp.]|nr:hypothetical protein [Geodermatophilus sp.]
MDAVRIPLVVGVMLLLGADPVDVDGAQGTGVLALTLLIHVDAALVAVLKGQVVLGAVGVFIPFLALAGALRLARPGSPWARRRHPPGSSRAGRALRRFPRGRRNRCDAPVDLFAAVPRPTATAQ